MLVLSRKHQEAVIVGPAVDSTPLLVITVVEIYGGRVKLGFEARHDLLVHRLEVWEQIQSAGSAGEPAEPGRS